MLIKITIIMSVAIYEINLINEIIIINSSEVKLIILYMKA
jgi:hypothetical protein